MAKKGDTKRKPSKIKKLEGTYRADRAPLNEMEVPSVSELPKPDGLVNKYADTEWLKVTRILSEIGMLHETDSSLLLAYCNEMGIYFECMVEVREQGFFQMSKANGKIISSTMKVGNAALQNAIKLADKFGFNPASRSKIEMPTKKPEDNGSKFL